MLAFAVLAGLICELAQAREYDATTVAAIRFAHFEVLSQQFIIAKKADFYPPSPDMKEKELEHRARELFQEFAPKFLALAEEDPTDEAALRCCEWIITYGVPAGGDREKYEADCTAWKMIRQHLSLSERMPLLCVKAAQYPTLEREQFLRDLPNDYRQPVEVHGMAFLALADLLAKRCELASEKKEAFEKSAPEWRDYITAGNRSQLLDESEELYQHVLDHYADLPLPVNASSMGKARTLGVLATRKLKALKN